jgi:hypothetical protein
VLLAQADLSCHTALGRSRPQDWWPESNGFSKYQSPASDFPDYRSGRRKGNAMNFKLPATNLAPAGLCAKRRWRDVAPPRGGASAGGQQAVNRPAIRRAEGHNSAKRAAQALKREAEEDWGMRQL